LCFIAYYRNSSNRQKQEEKPKANPTTENLAVQKIANALIRTTLLQIPQLIL